MQLQLGCFLLTWILNSQATLLHKRAHLPLYFHGFLSLLWPFTMFLHSWDFSIALPSLCPSALPDLGSVEMSGLTDLCHAPVVFTKPQADQTYELLQRSKIPIVGFLPREQDVIQRLTLWFLLFQVVSQDWTTQAASSFLKKFVNLQIHLKRKILYPVTEQQYWDMAVEFNILVLFGKNRA